MSAFSRLSELDVLSRHVVDAADGWLAAEGGVGAVMVVEVQPQVKGAPTGGLAAVDAYVGPFVEQGAVDLSTFPFVWGR